MPLIFVQRLIVYCVNVSIFNNYSIVFSLLCKSSQAYFDRFKDEIRRVQVVEKLALVYIIKGVKSVPPLVKCNINTGYSYKHRKCNNAFDVTEILTETLDGFLYYQDEWVMYDDSSSDILRMGFYGNFLLMGSNFAVFNAPIKSHLHRI